MRELAKPSSAKRLRALATLLAKCALAAALLVWLVRTGRLDLRVLVSVHFGPDMIALLVSDALMILLPLVRWYVLVSSRGLRVSFAQALASGLIGGLAGCFIPAGLGIDATRFACACPENRDRRADLLSTLVMDRLLGLLALTLLATVFGGILVAFAPTGAARRIVGASAFFLVGLLGLTAVLCSARLAVLAGPLRRWKPVARLSSAMRAYRHQPRVLAAGLFISILGHVGALSAAYFAFRALGVRTMLFAVFSTTPLVNLSGAIPLTPLGLGVTDSVAVALYSGVGLAKGAEVNMALRAVAVALSVCFGIAALLVPASRLQPTAALRPAGGVRFTADSPHSEPPANAPAGSAPSGLPDRGTLRRRKEEMLS